MAKEVTLYIDFTQTIKLTRTTTIRDGETRQEAIDRVRNELPLEVEADGEWAARSTAEESTVRDAS